MESVSGSKEVLGWSETMYSGNIVGKKLMVKGSSDIRGCSVPGVEVRPRGPRSYQGPCTDCNISTKYLFTSYIVDENFRSEKHQFSVQRTYESDVDLKVDSDVC